VGFGHSRATLEFWRALVSKAIARTPTPFFLFSIEPIIARLADLRQMGATVPVPIRHWLSCKTQPVPQLLRWWAGQGLDVEVVSEFEFLAARKSGFSAPQILVNGPAKHRWLATHKPRGIRVHFDSLLELEALLPLVRKLGWRAGIRILTAEERDSEDPALPTQFGLEPDAALRAIRMLQKARLPIESVHFHLRTQVASACAYGRAIEEVARICRRAGWAPKFLDCGGGMPPAHVLSRNGKRYDSELQPDDLGKVLAEACRELPSIEEVWCENGRFLSAGSGVLVLRILDVKERRGLRQLICDGGRTMNALISTWETHGMFSVPARSGRSCRTAVYGPTCMAFDQLALRQLPRRLTVGDTLIWMDAGAYHIPWETRFSHGQAAVLWHDGNDVSMIREAGTFQQWWGDWRT
jgi:diaminopimelate decarboxylase